MLENAGGLLPLDARKVTGLALIGPAAGGPVATAVLQDKDTLVNYCGDYAQCGNCPANHTVTMADGIRNHFGAAGL